MLLVVNLFCLNLFTQEATPVEAAVQTTFAKKIGTTPPIRDLVPRKGISPEKRKSRKKDKIIVPNFRGRAKSTANVANPLPLKWRPCSTIWYA